MSREREIGAVVIVFIGCSISDQALKTVDQNNRVSLVCIAESTHSPPVRGRVLLHLRSTQGSQPRPAAVKTKGLASAPSLPSSTHQDALPRSEAESAGSCSTNL